MAVAGCSGLAASGSDLAAAPAVGGTCGIGGRTVCPLRPPHLNFFGGRLRRDVVVEDTRLGLLDVLGHHDADDDVLVVPERTTDTNPVALPDHAMRLGVLAVHLDLAALTRALGLRPRLVKAADVEPDVDADSVAQNDLAQMRISTLPLAASALMSVCVCS